MATVRKFSVVGPCLNLGELVKTTAKFFVYVDRHGETKRIARDKHEFNHIEACVSCRDHTRTQYPRGYED
jgi:hypothetical protein